MPATIKIIENGPAIIEGAGQHEPLIIYEKDKLDTFADRIALCRCGKSTDQPYCDGSHKKPKE